MPEMSQTFPNSGELEEWRRADDALETHVANGEQTQDRIQP